MKDLTSEEEIIPLKALSALEAVLLFHSNSPWTFEKNQHWQRLCRTVFETNPKYDEGFEASTKMLCDVVRAALGRKNAP